VFQYCHCSRCRKFTGSAHASSIIIDPPNLEWLSGEEHVGRFELPEAKHYATSFCKHCGSSLPWLIQSGKAVIVPAGTLDDDPQARPIHNVYYADRAPWYEDAGSLINMMCCRKNKTVGCAVRTENTIQEDIHGAHGAPYNRNFFRYYSRRGAENAEVFIFVFSGIKNLILSLRALRLCEINSNP